MAAPLPRFARELPARHMGLPDAPEAEDADPLDVELEDVREPLEDLARGGIIFTAMQYNGACEDVKDAIRERARAARQGRAWFFDLLVDVVAGTLLPSLASGLFARAVDSVISSASPRERGPRSPEALRKLGAWLKNSEQTKALFGEATSAINAELKSAYAQLASERSETETFVSTLASAATEHLGRLYRNANRWSVPELLAVSATYHEGLNTRPVLAERIARLAELYGTEVEPIGDAQELGRGNIAIGGEDTTKVVLVVGVGGSIRPALVELRHLHLKAKPSETVGRDRYRFLRWFSPEMAQVAVAKERDRLGGGELEVVEERSLYHGPRDRRPRIW